MSLDLLPLFGATPVAERVVRDRNRITGAGVTAGIDFALVLAAELFGESDAQRIQLAIEYDPHPPYRQRLSSHRARRAFAMPSCAQANRRWHRDAPPSSNTMRRRT